MAMPLCYKLVPTCEILSFHSRIFLLWIYGMWHHVLCCPENAGSSFSRNVGTYLSNRMHTVTSHN